MLRLALALLGLLIAPISVGAAEFYASPTGSGTICSEGSPCTPRTFIQDAAKSAPGNILILKDGVYTGADSMLDIGAWATTRSGTSSARITIRAENDGAVTIDGDYVRRTVRLNAGNHWWLLEGFDVRHSSHMGIENRGGNTIVRRVVVYDLKFGGSASVAFWCADQPGNLFEDVAGFGIANNILSHAQGNGSCTFRRAYGRVEGSADSSNFTVPVFGMAYNSEDFTCDNCIGEYRPNIGTIVYDTPPDFPNGSTNCPFKPGSSTQKRCSDGAPAWPGGPGPNMNRFDSCTNCGYPNHNAFIGGSLFFARAGTNMSRIGAGFSTQGGAIQSVNPRVGGDVHFEHVIWWVDASLPNQRAIKASGARTTPSGPSSFTNISTVAALDDDIIEDAETTQTGHFTVTGRVHATSLNGLNSQNANPWAGTAGGNLCDRYVNRSRTTTPLWPWPMNDRIKAASSLLGTYGAGYAPSAYGCGADAANCTGSFPERGTIDVMETIQQLLGPIPPECSSGTIPPPGSPSDPVIAYTIDEAASGQTPTAVADSQTTPLDLALTYTGGQPVYTEIGTGRGLEWATVRSGGGASAEIDGTKVKTTLQGATKATLVVVADLDDVTPASGVETPWRLALAPTGNTGMSVIVNGVGAIWSGYNWPTAGRQVFHAVVDTTQAAAANRVRLYIDGVDQGNATSGTSPSLNATLDLQAGQRLNLGNNALSTTNDQSIDGRIYYAAICAGAMSPADVATDATALLADDDTAGSCPAGAPPPASVLFVGNSAGMAISNSVATLTPGLVSGAGSTDHYLAMVLSRTAGTAPVWTFPPEWEQVGACHQTGGGNIALQVWQKTGSAPTVAPAISISDIGFGHMAALAAWRNTPDTLQGVPSSSPAITTWVPGTVTTITDNTRVVSVVATAGNNSLVLQNPGAFVLRMGDVLWDTPTGPLALGLADTTQGQAGIVAMPTWQQTRDPGNEWCGITVALGLITEASPEPPPQGGGPIPIPRFLLTNRPIVTDRPLVTPLVVP